MNHCDICGTRIGRDEPSYQLAQQFPDSVICEDCRERIKRIGSYSKTGDPRIEKEVYTVRDMIDQTDLPSDMADYIGSFLRRSIKAYNANADNYAGKGKKTSAPVRRSRSSVWNDEDSPNDAHREDSRAHRNIDPQKKAAIYRWVALLLVFVSMMGMFLPWVKLTDPEEASDAIEFILLFSNFQKSSFSSLFGEKGTDLIVSSLKTGVFEQTGVLLDENQIKKDLLKLKKIFRDGGYSPVELKTIASMLIKYAPLMGKENSIQIRIYCYAVKYILTAVLVLYVLAMISILFNQKKGLLIATASASITLALAWIIMVVVANHKVEDFIDGKLLSLGTMFGIFVTVACAITAMILYAPDRSKPVIRIADAMGWLKNAFVWTKERTLSGADGVRTYVLQKEYLRKDWACGFCGTGNNSVDKFCRRCGAKRPDMMRCRKCGTALFDGDSAFCSNCGAPISRETSCRYCGIYLAPDALFCTRCGRPVDRR